MTDEQEKHLLFIKQSFDILVDGKYRRGQDEHGGDLSNMPIDLLLDNAIYEAIDQVVYLLTLRTNLFK